MKTQKKRDFGLVAYQSVEDLNMMKLGPLDRHAIQSQSAHLLFTDRNQLKF